MMNMKNLLFTKVRKWGREKGITNGKSQFAKVVEEIGEAAHEISRGTTDSKAFEDAIGDILVTVIILADIYGYDAEDCLALAWKEIKDRKGKSVDGVFVKESDLK